MNIAAKGANRYSQRHDRNIAVAPPMVSGERFGSLAAVGVSFSAPQELGPYICSGRNGLMKWQA
ncbi:hypothetical protein ABLE86_13605 [Mesorhizobium sp. KR2-14]